MKSIEPKINGFLFNVFKAKLVNYNIGACDYKDGYILPISSIIPVRLDGIVGLRALELEIDFEGNTKREITMNISKFTVMLHKGADIILPDGFHYSCVYESATDPEEEAPWIMKVKFSLSCYRHGARCCKVFNESGKLFVEGNYKTPAVFTITPFEGVNEVTVNGITVNSIDGTVIIDGINKTVTSNGINIFANTDITKFPVLETGYNDIQIRGNASVEVSYYPIYL